jgi:NAD(P)-dependent dehydrogenase (short-subunit alcohol dehydrogenase family)
LLRTILKLEVAVSDRYKYKKNKCKRSINLTGKRPGDRRQTLSIVSRLADAGARVVVNYILYPEAASALVDSLNKKYGEGTAYAIQADISKEEEVTRMFKQAGERLGGLDILVNNAGTESMYDAMEMPMSEWDRVHGVNLRGAFMCARTFAAMARPREQAGW